LAGKRSLFTAAWPASQRSALAAALQQGNVAVKASSCGVELLPACSVHAKATTAQRLNCCDPVGACGGDELNRCSEGRELYTFDVADELRSGFPAETANLLPELEAGRVLRLRAESNAVLVFEQVAVPEVEGCRQATHYVRQARIGSFEVDVAASNAWNAASVRRVAMAGKQGACGNHGSIADAGCAEPFFLELEPLRDVPGNRDASTELQCSGLARPHVVGGVGGLDLLKDHPDPELRPFAIAGGSFRACAVHCGYGDVPNCEKQCASGKTASCVSLAVSLEDRQNAPQQARRRQLLEQACQKGNSYGCFQLAGDLERGGSQAPDLPAAIEAYSRACAVDVDSWASRACSSLADRYLGGKHGFTRDGVKATAYYRRACDLGYQGCQPLAMMLLHGTGVAKDVVAGVEVLRRACHKNSRKACVELGRLLVNGQGVAKNRELGVSYLKLGCNGLDRTSCADMSKVGLKIPPAYVE